MQPARIDYAEACRVKRLEAQAEAWHHASRLAEYVAAARAQVEALPSGQDQSRGRDGTHVVIVIAGCADPDRSRATG